MNPTGYYIDSRNTVESVLCERQLRWELPRLCLGAFAQFQDETHLL